MNFSPVFPTYEATLPSMGFCIRLQNNGILRNLRMPIDLGFCPFRPRPIVVKKLRMRIKLIMNTHRITSGRIVSTDILYEYPSYCLLKIALLCHDIQQDYMESLIPTIPITINTIDTIFITLTVSWKK